MSSSVIQVGLCQMSCVADQASNLKKAVSHIRALAAGGSQIICLQELFTSLYFCQTEDPKHFDLAEPVPGSTVEVLQGVARELGVVIIASLFEERVPGLYHNTTAVIDANGEYLGKYRKMHIPDDPGYYEKFYFTPGDLGYKVFQTRYAKIGVLICWDQWYPEAARLTALKGADILFYPTAIGWDGEEKAVHGESQYQAWQTVQRGHAISNGTFVVSCNRVGIEEGIEFWGGSFVSDPFGKILSQAEHDQEQNLIVECDLSQIAKTRQMWPFLRDRRIDSYNNLTKRFDDDHS